jgi:hypothetical protein
MFCLPAADRAIPHPRRVARRAHANASIARRTTANARPATRAALRCGGAVARWRRPTLGRSGSMPFSHSGDRWDWPPTGHAAGGQAHGRQLANAGRSGGLGRHPHHAHCRQREHEFHRGYRGTLSQSTSAVLYRRKSSAPPRQGRAGAPPPAVPARRPPHSRPATVTAARPQGGRARRPPRLTIRWQGDAEAESPGGLSEEVRPVIGRTERGSQADREAFGRIGCQMCNTHYVE